MTRDFSESAGKKGGLEILFKVIRKERKSRIGAGERSITSLQDLDEYYSKFLDFSEKRDR